MRNITAFILALALGVATLCAGLTLSGPALAQGSTISQEYNRIVPVQGFQGIAYAIADALENNLVQPLDRARPILFTSFVELDDLMTSSTFGRLLGEQVASRISQHGYRVMELKLRRDSMIISDQAGEIILSRELDKIRSNHEAQAVIVGTYTIVNQSIIVTTRILSALDGAILSSNDVTLRMTADLHALAGKNISRFQPGRPDAAKDAPTGPIGRGSVLLDPKNSLGARIIQTRLAELHYYKDRIDGIWGKNSHAALSRFKAERQLSGTAWDMPTQIELFRGTGQ